MFKPFARAVILCTLITLISACSSAATPIPSTATVVPSPMKTQTLVPPTATLPAPSPTQVVRLEKVATLNLPDSFINTIIFSPDSQTMITGDRNGEVLLWDCDTWEKIIFLPAQSTYAEDEAAGIWYWGTLALSPDGSMIINAYGDDGKVTGYDRTGQVMFTFSFGSRVWAVAISPDGRFLAVAGLPNNVVIIDLETYQQVTNLVSDYEYIFNLVFSPDGNTLVVGYERPGNFIKLWDTATWQETSTFTHISERIDYHDILFTPDGTQLILATNELGDPIGVRIWDLAGSRIVRELPQNSQAAYQIALSPDGSLLASVHEALQLWNWETGNPIKTIRVPNRELGAVAFSPDGALIAFSAWGEGVQVWAISPAAAGASPAPTSVTQAAAITSNTANVANIRCLRKLIGHDHRIYGLDFSPDGSLFGSYSLDGVVQIWDRASWQVVQELRTPSVYGWRLFFLPDGRHISSGDGMVWDLISGEQVFSPGAGYTVTFSSDGAWMAGIYRGNPIIRIWRVENWQLEREITADPATLIFTLAISPDSRLLATTSHSLLDSQEHSVILWDMETGRELLTLPGHRDVIHGLAFSPDGRWIASASMDTTINLWDVQSGQLVYTFHAAAEMFDVTFSPDSSLVAAAMNNNTVELWDVDSGQWVRTLNHNGEVVSVAFSPDGTLLASGAYDGKIYIWGVP